jgi:hypothetical protein
MRLTHLLIVNAVESTINTALNKPIKYLMTNGNSVIFFES